MKTKHQLRQPQVGARLLERLCCADPTLRLKQREKRETRNRSLGRADARGDWIRQINLVGGDIKDERAGLSGGRASLVR